MSERTSNRRTPIRPPRLPSLGAAIPKGPKWLQIPKADQRPINDWYTPPEGFVTATTSKTEWTVYKGLWYVLHCPGDPHDGPWIGSPPLFSYQNPYSGGRQIKGGAVIDYLVQPSRFNSFAIAIRLQTEYYHTNPFGSNKRMLDLLQEQYISSDYQVRDLQELSFINDPNGSAVCKALINVLSGFSQPDPLAGGTPTVVRDRP